MAGPATPGLARPGPGVTILPLSVGEPMDHGGVSIDPICGKPVVEDDADSLEYKRKTYYFCSPRCRGRFERQAERMHVSELWKLGVLFAEKKARWGVA